MPGFAARPHAFRASSRLIARGLLCAAPPALALLACMHDSEPQAKLGLGAEKGTWAYSDTAYIVETVSPSASRPGRFVTRAPWHGCLNAEMLTDTATDTTLYTLGKGVLNAWSAGDCLATRMEGESSRLAGTWSFEGQDSVAKAWRPATCPAGELSYPVYRSGVYVISKETAVFRTNGGLCLARVYGENLAAVLDSVSVSPGCDEVTLGAAGGKSGTMTSEMGEDGVRLTFSHGDTTCAGILRLASQRPRTCPDTGMDSLSECLTDFFLESFFESRGAAKRGRERETRRAATERMRETGERTRGVR